MNKLKYLLPLIIIALGSMSVYSRAQSQASPAVTYPNRPDPELDLGFEYQLHSAAYYFAAGDMATASNAVHRALNVVPEDPQAEALRKLIEEQEQQDQDQQDQEENKDDEQNQDQQDQNKDKNKQDQEQQNQPEPKNDEQQQEDQQEQDQQQENEDQQPAETPKEDQRMTPEEAKMLLDALRQADLMFPIVPEEEHSYGTVLRDW